MKFTVITLFPEPIEGFLSAGLVGQALGKGLVSVETVNPREYTSDAHHTVDDRSFGGGDGMVMKYEPLEKAVMELRARGPCRVVALSPQGRPWNQSLAGEWAQAGGHFVLVSGRYAGIDNRFVVNCADEEISIGDFVLNGGEVAALAVIESVTRLVPGVLGNEVSSLKDSFSEGLLECPQFTRPREAGSLNVPAPLLSGDHKRIQEFQFAVSVVRTHKLRPELIKPAHELEKCKQALRTLSGAELRSLGLVERDLR